MSDEQLSPEARARIDALRASAGAEPAGVTEQPPRTTRLQVHQLDLGDVNVQVGDSEDGRRWLMIGPIGLHLRIPMQPEVAREIGTALTGGTVVAGPSIDLSSLGLDDQKIAAAAAEALRRERR